MNLAWEAYENDDAVNYDLLGLTDGETGIQNVTMAVPASTGIANYSFSASGSSGCPSTINYTINITVERIDFAPTVIILPDQTEPVHLYLLAILLMKHNEYTYIVLEL
jgi:hypothetical protein